MSATSALDSPRLEPRARAPTATLTWLGHATVLIDFDGVRLLTDPVLSDRIGPLVRVAPPPRVEDAERLDAILLSHLHYDHADLASLRRVGASTPVLAPRGAGAWLEAGGVGEVRELGPGEEASVGTVRVTATLARHHGRRRPLGVRAEPIGFVLQGSRSVYFAGDTDLFPGMADLAGRLDVALLPVSGWGPTLPEGHMGPEGAATAAALMAPRLAIPIHWGTFALWPPAFWARGLDQRPREFAALVRRHAPAVEIRVLAPGERTDVAT